MTPRSNSSAIGRAAAWVGVWWLLGLFFGSQNLLYAGYVGRKPSLRLALGVPFTDMTLWALFSPLVIALARRFPFQSGRILRSVAVHTPVAIVLSIVHAVAGGSFMV